MPATKPRFEIASDVTARPLCSPEERHGGEWWGPWRWDPTHETLDFTGGQYSRKHPYWIDVREIREAEDPRAEIWDWVTHLLGKRWRDEALGPFLCAMRYLVPGAFSEGGNR